MALKQRLEYVTAQGQAANAAGDKDATFRWIGEGNQISAEMEWIESGRHGLRPNVPPPRREDFFPPEPEQEASSEAQQSRLEREMGLAKGGDLTGAETTVVETVSEGWPQVLSEPETPLEADQLAARTRAKRLRRREARDDGGGGIAALVKI